jgi:hypothetical protein
MSLCDQCVRLTLAPSRNDVPFHLHTSDTSTGHIATVPKLRIFNCEICHARWDWRNVSGWYLKTPDRSSEGMGVSNLGGES